MQTASSPSPSAPAPTATAHHDVIVIGGGPAGLTAAIYLARFRRDVLLLDGGDSRAARIPLSHNYPGFPAGIVGTDLVAGMRQQAQRYGAQIVQGCVTSLTRQPEGYLALWEGGRAQARMVLLATGTSDVEPPMPHLAQAIRDGAVRYCPVCDGHEVIDQEVGVLTNSAGGVAEALYLRHFTEHLTLFVTHGGIDFSSSQLDKLRQAGVRLCEEPVTRIELADEGVALWHGQARTAVASLYGTLGMRVHSDLAVALGADHDEDGYLLTDRHYQTSVPGLFAAGDIVKGLNQITVATGTAAIASAAMHRMLPAVGWPGV